MKKIAGHLCNTFRNVTFHRELDFETGKVRAVVTAMVAGRELAAYSYPASGPGGERFTIEELDRLQRIAEDRLRYVLHLRHRDWKILDDNLETDEPSHDDQPPLPPS